MTRFSRLIVLIAMLFALTACSGTESFGSKSEWSVLQGLEFDHRVDRLSAPVVLNASGYRVAGFPRTDAAGTVWVMLNPKSTPLYKQLPQASFSLSSAQLAGLGSIEPSVLARLKSHVRE
jgi:hypothetical protein